MTVSVTTDSGGGKETEAVFVAVGARVGDVRLGLMLVVLVERLVVTSIATTNSPTKISERRNTNFHGEGMVLIVF